MVKLSHLKFERFWKKRYNSHKRMNTVMKDSRIIRRKRHGLLFAERTMNIFNNYKKITNLSLEPFLTRDTG